MNLQLAFCYELGFGVDRDPVISQSLLDESGAGPWIFDAMIEEVKRVETLFEFVGTQFGGLHSEGFIPEFDPSQQYREEKRLIAAESQYRREIRTFGLVLGNTNILVQKVRQQLAFLLDSEGRWKDAEIVQLEMISFTETATHFPLRFSADLARTYWKQGRYTEAEKLARTCVMGSKELLGEDHLTTQASKQLLALVLHSQTKRREASQIANESVQILRKIMGENHPDTIASLENQVLRYSMNPEIRERRLRQTLAMWTSVVGRDHPNTLANMDHLAQALIDGAKFRESKVMHQQAYELRKLHLGEEHPDTLKSMSHLAWVANTEGKYEEAEKIHQRALDLTELNLGKDHPEMLRRLIERASLRIHGRGYEKAEEIDQQRTTEWNLGAEHLDLLESIDNVGRELGEIGRHEEAEQVYRRAITLKERVFGKETIHVTKSMDGLGHLFSHKARYEEAEKIFRQAFAIRESILGKDHYLTESSLCGLVGVLQNQKRYGEADDIARGSRLV